MTRFQPYVPVILGGLLVAFSLAQPCAHAQEKSFCATVKIEIKQELTLERQAFEAHMRINNGLTTLSLDDVAVTVTFANAQGRPVIASSDPDNTNALFFIRLDRMNDISDVSGGGSVRAASSADIYWLIIPAYGAGGPVAAGVKYFVGAKLTYKLNGEAKETVVVPDTIFVKPMPLLVLDYFLPSEVYGDDAFTDPIEPPIPFPLGVRVRNNGYGAAKALKISSSQPKIVENKQGLLVGFQITGSEVNGEPATASLNANFGDIASRSAKVANWVMECTLSGRFVEFTAEFTHADELGGELTSLMDRINTHFLVRNVLVDAPGRDTIRDFLAKDGNQYMIYESDNVDTNVTDRSPEAVFRTTSKSGPETTYYVDVPVTAGPLFVKQLFTANSDDLEIVSALRSDGKYLSAVNVWFSKSRTNGTEQWRHYLNLFDVDGGGTYSVRTRSIAGEPKAPVLGYIKTPAVAWVGDPLGFGFVVEATDQNGTIPVLSHTRLPSGATFTPIATNNSAQGYFFWRPQTNDYGAYLVKFTASDGELTDDQSVRIYVGLPGEATNEFGVPLSLLDWSVSISNLIASSTTTYARIQWDGIPGVSYDIYASASLPGQGMTWTQLDSNRVAMAATESYTDAGLATNIDRRFYQVVFSGDRPGAHPTNKIWGIIRNSLVKPYEFIAPPLRGDTAVNGEFGQRLAESLTGHNGGPGDGVGDELYIPQPDGSWRVIYLDAAGAWREADGALSTYRIPDGMGLLVNRNSTAPARPLFAGEVGNDRSRRVTVRPGWNLLALSEGYDISLPSAFTNVISGTVRSSASTADADQIVMEDDAGHQRWLMYNNRWIEVGTTNTPSLTIRPGRSLRYYRNPTAGNLILGF